MKVYPVFKLSIPGSSWFRRPCTQTGSLLSMCISPIVHDSFAPGLLMEHVRGPMPGSVSALLLSPASPHPLHPTTERTKPWPQGERSSKMG